MRPLSCNRGNTHQVMPHASLSGSYNYPYHFNRLLICCCIFPRHGNEKATKITILIH